MMLLNVTEKDHTVPVILGSGHTVLKEIKATRAIIRVTAVRWKKRLKWHFQFRNSIYSHWNFPRLFSFGLTCFGHILNFKFIWEHYVILFIYLTLYSMSGKTRWYFEGKTQRYIPHILSNTCIFNLPIVTYWQHDSWCNKELNDATSIKWF